MHTSTKMVRSILAGCFLSMFLAVSLHAQPIVEPEDVSELTLLPLVFNMDNEDIDWEGYTFFPFAGAVLERVENPDKSGLNENDYVLRYEKAAGDPWAGFFYDTDEVIEIDDESVFRLKILSNTDEVDAMLKLEMRAFDVESAEMHADVTAAGEWIQLEWDISDVDRDTPWDRVTIILDLHGPAGTGGDRFTWYLDEFSAGSDGATSVDGMHRARLMALDQNHPNPFGSTTTITYSLSQSAHATLEVYDLLGRKVATLVDDVMPQGRHQATLDASSLSSGLYIYRLRAGNDAQSRTLTLTK